MAVITDPISDMLTRIRNAVHVKQESVRMPSSKLDNRLFHISYKFPIYSLNFVFNIVTLEVPEE